MVKLTHDTSLESLFKPHLIILYTISGTTSEKKKKGSSERY